MKPQINGRPPPLPKIPGSTPIKSSPFRQTLFEFPDVFVFKGGGGVYTQTKTSENSNKKYMYICISMLKIDQYTKKHTVLHCMFLL